MNDDREPPTSMTDVPADIKIPAAVRVAAESNEGRPVRWIEDPAPGGWVCAVPDPGCPDGICGNPVESEPCGRHEDPSPEAKNLGQLACETYDRDLYGIAHDPDIWATRSDREQGAWFAAAGTVGLRYKAQLDEARQSATTYMATVVHLANGLRHIVGSSGSHDEAIRIAGRALHEGDGVAAIERAIENLATDNDRLRRECGDWAAAAGSARAEADRLRGELEQLHAVLGHATQENPIPNGDTTL